MAGAILFPRKFRASFNSLLAQQQITNKIIDGCLGVGMDVWNDVWVWIDVLIEKSIEFVRLS
jgi:hypothetical protein